MIVNNRFLNHIDGRYIQFNGSMADPVDTQAIIKGNYFGRYQVGGNNCVQTQTGGETIIEGNVFNTGASAAGPTSDIVVSGNVRITNNIFKSDGPSLGGYHISTATGGDNAIIDVAGCVFKGDRAQAIRIGTTGNIVTVSNCYFTNDMAAHIRLEGNTTDLTVSSCRFKMTSGDDGIRIASGVHPRIRVNDCEFDAGSDAIQIDAGATVTKLYIRDNEFTNQTTGQVSNAGTITTINARGNIGYLDIDTFAKGVAIHGSNAAYPRPSNYTSVEWIGSVSPNNATDNDTWVDTSL
jgi:hypothetical protein